jgi:hypothetical protein
VFEINVPWTSKDLLAECAARGLVVKLDTVVRTKPGGRHWHLGFPKRPGTLEVTDTGREVSLKVATNRDGGWATALAMELAAAKRRTRR